MSEERVAAQRLNPIATIGEEKPTPRSIRSDAHNYKQSHLRVRIGDEMASEMVICDVQTFLKHYLPFVPDPAAIDAATKHLVSEGLLERTVNAQYRWTDFKNRPSSLDSVETKVFLPLTDICHALATYGLTAGRETREPQFKFDQSPYNSNPSELAGSNHQIDGFFKPIRSTDPTVAALGRVPVADVAVSAEFKRRKLQPDIIDNRLKIVAAANYVMNDDPRRMFTYGITIEDERMSLWYFSRSHSAKSESFDFTKDCAALVYILFSFIFATEEQMGYDPSIHRFSDGKHHPFYVYELPSSDGPSRYFKTLRSLSEYRSLCITGRMTRVWEAVEVDSLERLTEVGTHVALKDVWLDENASTEKEIQTAIFNDVAGREYSDDLPHVSRFSDEMKAEFKEIITNGKYRDYFLHILCDYQGQKSKALPSTAHAIRDLFSPPDSASHSVPTNPSRGLRDPARSLFTPAAQTSNSSNRRYLPKRQYRLVYEEVCTALHDTDNLADVLTVLRDCLTGLQILFYAGWVHRDISSGNVLGFRINGPTRLVGKISDLEYAKRFDSRSGSSDPKTGTPFFMPLQVLTQAPMYRPEKDNDNAVFGQGPAMRKRHRIPIIFNFQHDLESMWWLLLWIITQQVNHEASRSFASSVFTNSLTPTTERRNALLVEDYLQDHLQSCLHESVRHLDLPISQGGDFLYHEYFKREKNHALDDLGSYSWVYDMMHSMLVFVQSQVADVPLQIRHQSLVTSLCPRRLKRQHASVTKDHDDYVPLKSDNSGGESCSDGEASSHSEDDLRKRQKRNK